MTPESVTVAAPVERARRHRRRGEERDAVAGADRQLAAARDRGAGIGVDVGGAGLRPRGPGADRDRAERRAARQRELRRAEAEGRRDRESEQKSDEQAHESFRLSPAISCRADRSAGRRDGVGPRAIVGAALGGCRVRVASAARRVLHHALDPHQDVDRALGQQGRPRLRRSLPAAGAAATAAAAGVGPGATPGIGFTSMP